MLTSNCKLASLAMILKIIQLGLGANSQQTDKDL